MFFRVLWGIRFVRLMCGTILFIVGAAFALFPILPGFIFLIPGLVLLVREVPLLRNVAALCMRRFPRLRKIFRRLRAWIRLKTGWHLHFRKSR